MSEHNTDSARACQVDIVALIHDAVIELRRIADAVERQADRADTSAAGSELQSKAITLLVDAYPSVPPLEVIAENMGVTRRTLYRWKRFMRYYTGIKQQGAGSRRIRRGFRTGDKDSRRLEAED